MRLLGRAFATGVLVGAALVAAGGVVAVAQSEPAFFDLSGMPRGGGRGPAVSSLAPPDGARAIPAGRHATNTTFESEARLETRLSPSAVAAHYVSQMESARWRVVGRLTDGNEMVVTRLATPDGVVEPKTAVLILDRLSETSLDAALQFFNVRSAMSPASRPGEGSAVMIAQGATSRMVKPPPIAVINAAPPGEERLLREILLFDEVSQTDTYEIQPTMPAGFPTDLLPPGATTGTVAVASDQTTVVAIAPALAPTAASMFVRDLAAARWRLDGQVFGGLYSRNGVYVSVCTATHTALLRFVPRAGCGTYVRAAVTTAGCGRTGRRPSVDVAMPILLHPPGSSALDGGRWNTRLGSGLTLPDLATYYIGEMSKSDWPLTSRLADAQLVVTRHRSPTRSGAPVHAILTLLRGSNSTTTDVWLRIVESR